MVNGGLLQKLKNAKVNAPPVAERFAVVRYKKFLQREGFNWGPGQGAV